MRDERRIGSRSPEYSRIDLVTCMNITHVVSTIHVHIKWRKSVNVYMKIFVYACVVWDKGLTYLVCASLTQVGYIVQAHCNKVVFAMHMGLLGTRNSPRKVPHHKSHSNPSLSECEFITYIHMYMCRKHNRSYMESKWHLSIQPKSLLCSNMLTCSLTTSIPNNACRDSCRGIS